MTRPYGSKNVRPAKKHVTYRLAAKVAAYLETTGDTAGTIERLVRDEMNTISKTSFEALGISPDELTGLTLAEITDLIHKVQDGVQGEKMTEEEITDAALIIYNEANS